MNWYHQTIIFHYNQKINKSFCCWRMVTELKKHFDRISLNWRNVMFCRKSLWVHGVAIEADSNCIQSTQLTSGNSMRRPYYVSCVSFFFSHGFLLNPRLKKRRIDLRFQLQTATSFRITRRDSSSSTPGALCPHQTSAMSEALYPASVKTM